MNQALRKVFCSLTDLPALAGLLGESAAFLRYHLYVAPYHERYVAFHIPKRSGLVRRIEAPNQAFSRLQTKLNRVLLDVYQPRKSAHGFTRRRGLLTNAQPHVGKRWVLNIDLEGFFATVNFGRVRGMFMAPPFSLPSGIATPLANLCCFQNALPQGAPTSPTVSNLVAWSLDRAMEGLAARFRCSYTRYADDLTFSTNHRRFPENLASVGGVGTVAGPDLAEAVRKSGFRINERKTRLAGRSARQEVTGLVVNQRLNVSRRFVRELRGLIHLVRTRGVEGAQLEFEMNGAKRRHRLGGASNLHQVITGKLAFMAMVRTPQDSLYRRLAETYARLENRFSLKALPDTIAQHPVTQAVSAALWVLETTEDDQEGNAEIRQGTGFSVVGGAVVTCAHVLGALTVLRHHATGAIHPFVVTARDEDLDLAVLRPVDDCPAGELIARQTAVSILENVFAVGFPNFGTQDPHFIYPGQVTGIRSEAGRGAILTNAQIIFGMSGGPLVDAGGQVVGILKRGAANERQAEDTEKKVAIPVRFLGELLMAQAGEGGPAA